MGLREMESRLPPGFRFYPSDEELVCFYLRRKVANERLASGVTLVEVDLHAREPWELPEVAKLTTDEWYFFSFRDRKYATGSRTNRATETGYWKATGKDRPVYETTTRRTTMIVGMRKTLVFYRGRAPDGHRTGWVMHEFRLDAPNSPSKEDWVLCRVFNKSKASEAEESSDGSRNNHAMITGAGTGNVPGSPTAAADLGSPPDNPTVADRFDGGHLQIAAAMDSSSSSTQMLLMHGNHMGGSSCAMLNLAMLQYYNLLEEYCPVCPAGGAAMHDGVQLQAVPANDNCSDSKNNDAMVELGRAGFEPEHGMEEMEMEMEMEMEGGGTWYKDGLYFQHK